MRRIVFAALMLALSGCECDDPGSGSLGMCNGRGTLVDGVCECEPGWLGMDCSRKYTGGGSTPCVGGCGSRGVCDYGVCQCRDGFSGPNCEQPPPPQCDPATAMTSCTGSLLRYCNSLSQWVERDCGPSPILSECGVCPGTSSAPACYSPQPTCTGRAQGVIEETWEEACSLNLICSAAVSSYSYELSVTEREPTHEFRMEFRLGNLPASNVTVRLDDPAFAGITGMYVVRTSSDGQDVTECGPNPGVTAQFRYPSSLRDAAIAHEAVEIDMTVDGLFSCRVCEDGFGGMSCGVDEFPLTIDVRLLTLPY